MALPQPGQVYNVADDDPASREAVLDYVHSHFRLEAAAEPEEANLLQAGRCVDSFRGLAGCNDSLRIFMSLGIGSGSACWEFSRNCVWKKRLCRAALHVDCLHLHSTELRMEEARECELGCVRVIESASRADIVR